MKKLLIFATVLMCQLAFAGNDGGGGDDQESVFYDIATDIRSWIKQGGSNDLKMPYGISVQTYNETMLSLLAFGKTVVVFTDEEVKVDDKPKTCKNFLDSNKKPNILCNITRFKETSESGKYRLVHHEFASLADIEAADGAASDYTLSNQITDYLEKTVVLKLAVKKVRPNDDLEEKYAFFFKELREPSVYIGDADDYSVDNEGFAICGDKSCSWAAKNRAHRRSQAGISAKARETCKPWGIFKSTRIETECEESVIDGENYSHMFKQPEEMRKELTGRLIYWCGSGIDLKCKD
jgi:hypothetical protein